MLKKVIVLCLLLVAGQYYGSEHQPLTPTSQQKYALIPQHIADHIAQLYEIKNFGQDEPALAGIYIALNSGFQVFPLDLVIKAAHEALARSGNLSSDASSDFSTFSYDLLSDNPSVIVDARSYCKNKVLDCLVVKGSARVDNLLVCGRICGLVNNCDPQGTATGITGATGFTGNQGTAEDARGAQGITGVTGPQGATGVTGFTGYTGQTGARGLLGAQGAQGNQGGTGSTGAQGLPGATGITGSTGFTGFTGFTGNNGPAGSLGITGNTGATLITQAYGYVYKQNANSQQYGLTVFYTNIGTLFNITYTTFTDPVIVNNAGTYEISFSASAYTSFQGGTPLYPSVQIGLLRNGVPVDGGRYGSGSPTESPTLRRQVNGQIMLTLNAGDQLVVVNTSSFNNADNFTTFIFADFARQNATLSMTVRRLA